ncbi:MAG: ribosome-recycling factor [Candidatus Paceibacterota bacterium]|jgi:ribosome recycling factor
MAITSADDFKKEAQNTFQEFKKEIGGVRANRPSTVILEEVKVNYYGNLTPLKHMGTISVVPPRELVVQLWDKEAVQPAAKAIETTSLGFTASVEGNTIRVFLPELSEERREELGKHVKKISEQFRIRLRQLRDEANKGVEATFAAGGLGEDQKFKQKELVQKYMDATNKEIEGILGAKIKEIEE